MLFTYKYVQGHEIEKFHRYSNFLFLKVWSRARTPFDSSKLDQYQELKDLYESFHYESDPDTWAFQFNLHIETIYSEFLKLTKSQQKQLRTWYKLNNSIQGLFINSNKIPITYEQLDTLFPLLSKELKKFYRRLYGAKSPFLLSAFGNLDTIKKSHYHEFFNENFDGHEGICPFCGINHLRGNDHSKLEAYDHLISKGKYPFSSINFRNLAVMCNECNSAYKHEQTILFTKKSPLTPAVRREAFYPYSKTKWSISFNITLLKPYSKKLKKNDIVITTTCTNKSNQVASWIETFGIEERYKAKILGAFAGGSWYNKFNDGIHTARKKYKNPGLTYQEWGQDLIEECEVSLFSEINFLKKPFFEECVRHTP